MDKDSLISDSSNEFRAVYTLGTLQDSRNQVENTETFTDNRIRTTKYKWYTFLPKNLKEQFRRFANIYFLGIAILMLVPGLTNISAVSAIAPLVFVLAGLAVKFNFEKTDFEEVEWRNINVGDIIKLKENEVVPADSIILSSSLAQSLCYVQTANLDGETNLKRRQAIKQTLNLSKPQDFADWRGYAETEQPNKNLDDFNGRIIIDNDTFSLSNDQLLLRGMQIKNTKFVYALVIFSGEDTKLMMNARATPSKMSSLEKKMNSGLLTVWGFMFGLCVISAIISVIILDKDGPWYLEKHSQSALSFFFFSFLSYIILFSYMIPVI